MPLRAPRTSRLAVLALLLGAGGLIAAGCGSGDDADAGPAASSAIASGEAEPPKGTPKPLARNIEQANEIIDGGERALDKKLEQLRGYPVVVNQWGSWCPPCRAEFPFFAESAQDHLDEIAFVGIDMQDDRGAAEQFLEEFPVPYPSVFDPDTEAAASLDWTGVSPTTWLIDARGEVVHMRPGAYANREQLEGDLERYLLLGS